MDGYTQKWLERVKPFIGVVFLQFGFAGMDVLSKAALNKGMSNYVLVVYRHAVAFLVITPFALILDKYISNYLSIYIFVYVCVYVKMNLRCFNRKVRPKMTFSIFMKMVALSVLE